MNKTLVALIASTAMLGMVGCTATRTQRSAGEQIDDATLLTKVKAALVADPVTEAHEINVDVNRGVVKLVNRAIHAAAQPDSTSVAGSPSSA